MNCDGKTLALISFNLLKSTVKLFYDWLSSASEINRQTFLRYQNFFFAKSKISNLIVHYVIYIEKIRIQIRIPATVILQNLR